MIQSDSNMAQKIARAACAFEQKRTGRAPGSVNVVLSENTLTIALHGTLSPAELAVARSPAGAVQVQAFHRELFVSASDSLRKEIKEITGVAVLEGIAEIEPAMGGVVGVFSGGTTVQMYLLAQHVPSDTWSGTVSDEQIRMESAAPLQPLN